jgi:hypothetical protein
MRDRIGDHEDRIDSIFFRLKKLEETQKEKELTLNVKIVVVYGKSQYLILYATNTKQLKH